MKSRGSPHRKCFPFMENGFFSHITWSEFSIPSFYYSHFLLLLFSSSLSQVRLSSLFSYPSTQPNPTDFHKRKSSGMRSRSG